METSKLQLACSICSQCDGGLQGGVVLTFADVHLVTVEASEGLGAARQAHRPGAASLVDAGHGPPEAAVHQRLQRLHCSGRTNTRRQTLEHSSLSELARLTALRLISARMNPASRFCLQPSSASCC